MVLEDSKNPHILEPGSFEHSGGSRDATVALTMVGMMPLIIMEKMKLSPSPQTMSSVKARARSYLCLNS